MGESRIIKAVVRRDLTTRERMLALITALAVAGVLAYQFPYLMLVRSVGDLTAEAAAAEKEIDGLASRIGELKAHEAEIKAAVKSGVAAWRLADRKDAILLLEDVSDEARRQGVSLVSVHPAIELDKDAYKEISMNLDLRGRYRELAEYLRNLEHLSRIVAIRKIRVEACPDSSSACATQLEAVAYMEK
jgi:Tfp pilus assembly protein PilO